MKVVITGGTGFIGKGLVDELLDAGHSIVLLTRRSHTDAAIAGKGAQLVEWDGRTLGAWTSHINGADAVLNFAGEPIAARRWTVRQKKRIVNSRVDATRAIVSAMVQADKKPGLLINASAVGYYGAVKDGEVPESAGSGADFLAKTCAQWELEAQAVEKIGARLVILRIGVVLGEKGGALEKMLIPFRMFVGGPVGSGSQWLPWVHRNDVTGIVRFALENKTLSGPLNVVAPEAVTMKKFCKAIGEVLHRPSWIPVPGLVMRIALGEMSGMLLTGQKVIPVKLGQAGYEFRFPGLTSALESILR